MQLGDDAIDEFIAYWHNNNLTAEADPDRDNVRRFDAINAAAGVWYLNTRSAGDFGDGGISFKSIMDKAMQCNWGPGSPPWPSVCRPTNWGGLFKPSAYAWTLGFLAWGSGYAVTDARYTTQHARYAVSPTGEQNKFLSPMEGTCNQNAQLSVPDFTPTYALQRVPYGRRSTGKQIVILARTDVDYISALAVALHIKRTIDDSAAPMVTADTYFACDSMKKRYADKTVCVIVLGSAARTDVENVFPEATVYASFSAWSAGADTADGYIDAASGGSARDNYQRAHDEAIAAYNAGY